MSNWKWKPKLGGLKDGRPESPTRHIFGFALVGAIVGEFLGAREGMGLLIAITQGSFDSNGVFAAMIVIAVVALIAEWILTMIQDWLLAWRPETTVNK
jgi:NitT/TauT family transport system permease protein